jgi:hypothetical protein
MNTIVAFGIDFSLTLLVGFLVMSYLRSSLFRMLVDLCGTEDRGRFWLAFSTVLLIGVPASAALGYRPATWSPADSFFDIARQLGQNIMGFLAALAVVGLVIGFFALVAPRVPRGQQS